jgi:hypothetical protein
MSSIGYPITVNAGNAQVTGNYRYVFPLSGGLQLRDMEVALTSGFVFNSVFNISGPVFGNNSFSYVYPTSAGPVTYSVQLQPGHYDISTINEALAAEMTKNKTYLIDDNGESVFYITMNVNAVYYGVSMTFTPVPAVLPSGWTLPAGSGAPGPALPLVTATPQIVIPPGGFSTLLGYPPATYPAAAQATQYISLSTLEAAVNPQWAFHVCIDTVNTVGVNSVPSSIYPFSFDVGFLGQQKIQPYLPRYYPCRDVNVNQLVISILDQDGKPAFLNSKYAQFTVEFRKR